MLIDVAFSVLKFLSVSQGSVSGDTTPCRMTGVTLHGVVSPDSQFGTGRESWTFSLNVSSSENVYWTYDIGPLT